MPLARALLVVLVALGCSAPAGPTRSPSPDARAAGYVAPEEAAALIEECGVTGTVDAYFRIPPGQTYHDIFPDMGLSPELDGAEEPFVVIYSGDISFMSTAPLPTLRNAVCMFAADGTHNIYPDVPLEVMRLPGGAHLGPPE